MTLERRIQERIYNPTVQDFFDEFKRIGLSQVTEDILAPITAKYRRPIDHALVTHVNKDKALFVYFIGESAGADADKTKLLAASCDLLWSLSLIYDDIYDHDLTRAGQTTSWAEYGLEDTQIGFKMTLDRTLDVLASGIDPSVKDLAVFYIERGIQSMAEVKRMGFSTPIEGILANYLRRCDFHQGFPLNTLFAYMLDRPREEGDLLLRGLNQCNLAGQIINDIRDCSPRSSGREPFSDIRNATINVPTNLLWSELSQSERDEFEGMFGQRTLAPNEVRKLYYFFDKYSILPRCGAFVREMYANFSDSFNSVLDPKYMPFITGWADYKMATLRALTSYG